MEAEGGMITSSWQRAESRSNAMQVEVGTQLLQFQQAMDHDIDHNRNLQS